MPRAGYRTCIRCRRNRSVRFFTPRGTVCADCQRKARQRASKARSLASRYDLTQEDFDALLEAQGGVCGACRQARAVGYKWSVDHDHKVAERFGLRASVRGLVCRRCNKVLRDVRDNHTVLFRLARYILHPPAWRVLHEGVYDE